MINLNNKKRVILKTFVVIPGLTRDLRFRIIRYAISGMTNKRVILSEAKDLYCHSQSEEACLEALGIQERWIPAYARMTKKRVILSAEACLEAKDLYLWHQ